MNLPSAWNRFQRGSSSAAHSRSNSSACSARTCKTIVFTWLMSALSTYVQEVRIDAKQRDTPFGQFHDLPAQVARLQPLERRREGADAWQYQAVGPAQLVLVGGDPGLRARVQQRALDRAQVADPVVDDGDHPKSPFEDGIPRPPSAIASRSARPSALAADSAM